MNRYRILYPLIFILAMLISFTVEAQVKSSEYSTKSKKAKKNFETALSFFRTRDYEEANYFLNKSLSYDSNFVEAYILLGQIASDQHQTDKAIGYYRKAIDINVEVFPKLLYMTASMELDKGYYYDALKHFKAYAVRPDADRGLRKRIEYGVDRCSFAIYQIEHPVPFDPVNLGPNVNTRNQDYINMVSVDNDFLIVTQRFKTRQTSEQNPRGETEDFFISYRTGEGVWGRIKPLTAFNTEENEGAMSMSPDNTTAIFTACHRKDGFGSCDLYISQRSGDKWSPARNMGPSINTRWWETNSSLSSDGKTLYFISNRSGGQGKSDIWMATKDKNGNWGNVRNLGNIVNSEGNEMTPYIHPDGRSLYFASDGHMGMGGLDLFVTYRDAKGNWSEPVNLGYPINTIDNEMGLVVNALGNLAYISSQREGGYGGYDVYKFDLYPEARPTAVTYMKGIVRDAETHEPLQANFELINLKTGKPVITSVSDKIDGSFMVVIPVQTDLALNIHRKGYLFYSDNFNVKPDTISLKPFLKNIDLQPIKPGESIVLKNIFFASGSYELEDKSFVELNKLYTLLEHNKSLKIEISGHTDNVGDEKANILLSQNRAKAVVNYLVKKGISPDRLSYKGYGETRPVADNDTEKGRQQNRRTEIKVIAI